MRKIIRTHKIHAAVLLLAGFFVFWTAFVLLRSPLETSKEVLIREGQGIYAIADVLKEKGVIDNKFVFVIYALATGNEKMLQAGRYVFKPGVTVPIIVYYMAKGFAESDDLIVTIPEGFNVFDIDRRLVSFGLIEEGEFAIKYHTDEGQFFPDTYRIKNKNANIKIQNSSEWIFIRADDNLKFRNGSEITNEIAGKMFGNFENKTAGIFKDLSVQKQEEVVILASVLEREARKEEDMRLVAGVIENRLARRMLLQIDATVAYGACLRSLASGVSRSKASGNKYCDVSQIPVEAEIKIDGPYNTYTRAELPPGPIANPGITAIQAVLHPIKSDYLYYLSTRDGSQVIFSKTAAEHAANRRKYLGI